MLEIRNTQIGTSREDWTWVSFHVQNNLILCHKSCCGRAYGDSRYAGVPRPPVSRCLGVHQSPHYSIPGGSNEELPTLVELGCLIPESTCFLHWLSSLHFGNAFYRVVSARHVLCFVCSHPRQGCVEMLAVEPGRQGEDLGSQLLRRAEGILLNFRCR